jgi:glycosyltransferase involved in cell wall biosynthesis
VTGPDSPTVTVVVATYNRSNVLRLAIESARAQTLAGWEMWVVGDACTDDTEAVVASFADDRIRFVNLAVNHGEQSGPNNEGIGRARGRYIAFLNHDDLWFPDHLERCVRALEEGGAGVVFSVAGMVGVDGRLVLRPSWSGRYERVRVEPPASSWVVRREVQDRVGPWRSFRELFRIPSQDWLRRAHAAGVTIDQVPMVTVLAVHSGIRAGSYARREVDEQLGLWRRMQQDPRLREQLLVDVAVRSSAELLRPSPLRHLHRAAYAIAWRVLGARARPVMWAIRYRRRGGLIDELRRVRGLPRHR